MRLITGLLITFIGIGTLGPVFLRAEFGPPLARASAIYSGQKHVGQFFATTQVKVHFVTKAGSRVTTYIYPTHKLQLTARSRIPVYYAIPKPSDAYYAGPGGDAYQPPSNVSYVIVNIAIVAVGLWIVGRSLSWQRRVLLSARCATADGPMLNLRWERRSDAYPTVIGNSPGQLWAYSWKVLPLKSRIDQLLELPQYFLRARSSARRKPSVQPWPDIAQASRDLRPHGWILLRSADQLFVPITRAEPIITAHIRPEATSVEQDRLTYCHRQLLGAYAVALNNARSCQVLSVHRVSHMQYHASSLGLERYCAGVHWSACMSNHIYVDSFEG
jgi:hypothetical protein